MAKGKWGESFLKSGLPLEHLTHMTFRELGWSCTPQVEFTRPDREGKDTWFELDLSTAFPQSNQDTELSFLIECKYHDLSRYWIFLPHYSSGRWYFNDRALNSAPFQTLRKPRARSVLDLAPLASNGIVVSEDGTKQDNAVYAAIQQLANGFVPFALSLMFYYNINFHNVLDSSDELRFAPKATALVPMIVTNARLYRLRPDVTEIDAIRQASTPAEIADELEWAWCYHDVPMSLYHKNVDAIKSHKRSAAEFIYRFPGVEESMDGFVDRPNWIAIVNIKGLAAAAKAISEDFLSLETRTIAGFLRPRRASKGRGARST